MLNEKNIFRINFIAYDNLGKYLKQLQLKKNKVTDIPKKTRKVDVIRVMVVESMITQEKEFSIYLGEEATVQRLKEQMEHIPASLHFYLNGLEDEQRILFQREKEWILLDKPLTEKDRTARNRDHLVRMMFQVQDHAYRIQDEMNAIQKIGIRQYIKK